MLINTLLNKFSYFIFYILVKKLILDQPDTVTAKGTIEHVVDNAVPVQKINDSTNNKQQPDVLLNEGPIDGLEIIAG